MKKATQRYKLPKRMLHRGESLYQEGTIQFQTRENAPPREITGPKKVL
jgi:hypothetical protein